MRKRFITALFIFNFLTGYTGTAQQRMLTIEEAVAAALKNNFDILLLKNDSAVYALNNSYAKAAFLPRFNASSAVLFNNNNLKQKLADGSERKQNGIRSSNINASVNMNWTVFDGFRMFATRDKLAEFVTLGNLTIKNQLINTISDIIKTYYNIDRKSVV